MGKNNNFSGGLFAHGKPKPLTIKETPLSAQIAEYLDNRGIYNDRLNCVSVESKFGTWIQGCKKGTPDRFAIIRGRIIFIETKMFGKKPSPEQYARHETLTNVGAFVIVADSFDSFRHQFEVIRHALEIKAKGR